ncbi:MAG TPA: hypothetical protein VE684_06400 [Crenalkalicoccus sp.]|jgi:site-specific DNA recombinase|nr:hypothetical protein [Crenalkalicoccus sp.]
MQALAGQGEQLRDDAERKRQLTDLAASLESFRGRVQRGLAHASFEQRRELVMLLIDRVVVTNADVEIRYALPTCPESEHVRFCHLRKGYFENPAAPAGAAGLDLLAGNAVLGADSCKVARLRAWSSHLSAWPLQPADQAADAPGRRCSSRRGDQPSCANRAIHGMEALVQIAFMPMLLAIMTMASFAAIRLCIR